MASSLQTMVDRQVAKTLKRGGRIGKPNQIRQRYFWSTYLFVADPTTNKVPAGAYDLFKAIPGASGQGYPTNVNLTIRETNWLNAGRVPDNQSIAITEIGATIRTPPLEAAAPGMSGGIFASLPAATQTYLAPGVMRPLPLVDAVNIAQGTVLEMTYLTNSVSLGLLADFPQAGGMLTAANSNASYGNADNYSTSPSAPVNGLPAAAFRRKLGVPITLGGGENMGMRLVLPRDIELLDPSDGSGETPPRYTMGTGWYEVCIDWWAIESFAEKS